MSRTIHPDGLPRAERRWAMVAVVLGIAMAVIDGAIANVALPSLAHAFRSSAAEVSLVVNAYQLAIVALLLPLAALGERLGYRRVYLAGLALFVVASAFCATAGSLAALIAARVVQGFGAAAVMSLNGALVRLIFPQARLGRGVGFVALAVAISAASGPTVASAILSVAAWPLLFAVNVPFGVAALLVGLRFLPWSERGERPFPLPSAGLNVVVFAAAFLGFDLLARRGGTVPVLLGTGCVALSVVTGAALYARERREARPLVPVDLLRAPLFAGSVATSIASFAAQALGFVAIPFLLETTLGRSAVETGLLMTPWPLAVAVAAPLAGRLADRISAAILGGAGLAALGSGLLLLATLPADAAPAGIAARMALCGAGFGLFQTPNNRVLLSAAPRTRAGAASGMLATARLTGQTLGVSVASIVFRAADRSHGPADCLLVAASLAAAAAALSLWRRRWSRTPRASAA